MPDQTTELRGLLSHATQRLLGDNIVLSDDQWRQPSRLPDWSRGHVATHVARQADALRRLAEGVLSGLPGQMYDGEAERDAAIDAGADRNGLDLQIDLDTSAGALDEQFERVAAADRWATEVELRGGRRVPARLLPLVRLAEVVLHHVDLDTGYAAADVEPEVAGWLLEWCALRLATVQDYPRLRLRPTDGGVIEVGTAGDPVEVSGPGPLLLGWLTRRNGPDGLAGADALELPSFG